MPRVRLEPMISVFERSKTVHALDRVATRIGIQIYTKTEQLKLLLLNRSTVFSAQQRNPEIQF
jgi:hypothetical protein